MNSGSPIPRHFEKPSGGHRFKPPESPAVVRVTASSAAAATLAGQKCLWMLVNLLSRQFRVVSHIVLDLPQTPLLPTAALFGTEPTLVGRLSETNAAVGKGEILLSGPEAKLAPEIDIHVGNGATPDQRASIGIGVWGADWNVFLGRPEFAPDDEAQTTNAVGPYFAACLGVCEVFRFKTNLEDGYKNWQESPLFLSLLDYQASDSWDGLRVEPAFSPAALQPFYLVGCGAVGQALIAALLGSGINASHVTVVDFDPVDDTNLNRYPLATTSDEGSPKTEVVKNLLIQHGHGCYAFEGKWEDYVARIPHAKQREDLGSLEGRWRFELVVSCVDKNPARHSIQSSYPKKILGGSTLDFRVQTAQYDLSQGTECLKCHNHLAPPPKSPELIARELSAMAEHELEGLAIKFGVPLEELRDFAHQDPKCGIVVPESLGPITGAPPPEFSVGFVSVAAGVLLFRDLWLSSNNLPIRAEGKNGYSFGFGPLRGREWVQAPNSTCDCADKGGEAFHRKWS